MTDVVPRPEAAPPTDTAGLRAEIRALVDTTQPVVELDHVGRTVFIAGDWSVIGLDAKPGDDALEKLIEASPDPEAVIGAINRALDDRVASVFAFASGDDPRFLKVLPTPNAAAPGAVNLLLGLASDAEIPPTALVLTAIADSADSTTQEAPTAPSPEAPSAGSERSDAEYTAEHGERDHAGDRAETHLEVGDTESTDAHVLAIDGGGGWFEPRRPKGEARSIGSRLDALPPVAKVAAIAGSLISVLWLLVVLPGRNPFGDGHTLPIWLWVIAPMLLWVGLRESSVGARNLARAKPLTGVALAAITLVAILFRVVDIESIPFVLFGDEAEQGLEARRVIDGEITSPFWTGWLGVPTMSFYYHSLGLRIFGDDVFGLRIIWAFVGIATVPVTYLLGRRLSGSVRFGLLSAALVATYHFHVHYSRLGSVQISDTLFLAVALWLYHRSVDRNLRQDWVALGFVTGLSMYFYAGARLTVIVVIALFAYQLISRRGMSRQHWIGFGLFLLAFAVVAAPMLQLAVRNWSEFNARLNDVSVLGPFGEAWFEEQRALGRSDVAIWWEQFRRSFLAFNRYEDTTVWYGLRAPLLDWFFGIVFMVGLVVSTVRVFLFRDERYAPLVAWWWAGMLTGAFLTLSPPSSQRIVTLGVPTAMLVAVGIVIIAGWLRRLHRSITYGRLFVVAALVFGFISYDTYFNEHPRDRFGEGHSALATNLAPFVNDLDPNQSVYFLGEPFVFWGYGTNRFLIDDHAARGVDVTRAELTPEFVERIGENTPELVFVIAVERQTDLDLIRSVWPQGDSEIITYDDGRKIGEIYYARTGQGARVGLPPQTVDLGGSPVPDAETLANGQSWRRLGVDGLGEVRGIDVRPDGSGAFAVDVTGLLVEVDADGARTRVVDITASPSEFTDVVVDATGVVWAVDAQSARMYRVDAEGNVAALPVDPAALDWVRGMGPGQNGTLWLASPVGARLTQVAGADGAVLQTIDLAGRQPVEAIGLNDASIWYVDAQTIALVKLAPDGSEQLSVPLPPFTSVEPPHLDLVGDVLWVSDPEGSAVQARDAATGEAMGDPVVVSRAPDGRIDKAIGIGVGADGRIWVTDSRAGAIAITPPPN